MVLRCAWLYFICLLRAEVKTTRSSDLYLTIRFTMKFTIEHRDRVAIVTSAVEKLDALHAPDLKAELVQLAKSGHLNIVLDLTESRYCDSSGLSAVLVGNRMCRDEHGTFVLCGLQPTVEKLVQISQLDRVLNITPTLNEAVDFVYMDATEKELGTSDEASEG